MARESTEEKLSYRNPMPVKEVIAYPNNCSYPVCPKCKNTFEREYQSYCDRCGQCLKWNEYNSAVIINKSF